MEGRASARNWLVDGGGSSDHVCLSVMIDVKRFNAHHLQQRMNGVWAQTLQSLRRTVAELFIGIRDVSPHLLSVHRVRRERVLCGLLFEVEHAASNLTIEVIKFPVREILPRATHGKLAPLPRTPGSASGPIMDRSVAASSGMCRSRNAVAAC